MKPKKPRPPFRVQIVMRESLDYFRETVLGVRREGFESGRLVFPDRWLEHELEGDLRDLVRRDDIHGIVTAVHNHSMAAKFRNLGVPVVNVSNSMARPPFPLVTQDDRAVGRLAAGHLRDRGCLVFGFWGQLRARYSDERREGFVEALGPGAAVHLAGCLHEVESRAELYARMKKWLSRLAPPLGLFAVMDPYALLLMRAARDLGWRVPEDVAVLGAGDEDFWVEFESVPLSSVRLPARQIGHQAAILLDRLIARGPAAGAGGLRVDGAVIEARRSTDVVFLADEAVAKAVRFIREHAAQNPYIDDVARAAGISRSGLQSRFRQALGRTVLEEIRRVRIGRAQTLLAQTDLPVSAVAERCGFPNSQRFSVLFHQVTGHPPTSYRRRFVGRKRSSPA